MDFEPREILAKYAPYLQNESMIMYIETQEKETLPLCTEILTVLLQIGQN